MHFFARVTSATEPPYQPKTRLLILGAIIVLPLVFGFGLIEYISATSAAGSFIQFTQIGANPTLCSPGTLAAENYAAIYDLYGTLTPTPRSIVQKSAAPTSTPVFNSDSMETAIAALPTSGATITPTVALYMTDTPRPGNARQGELIFAGDGACVACHDVTDGRKLTGPSLKGIAIQAASREKGVSASAYLRESILHPDAYLVAGYAAATMPQSYGDRLNVQQVEDVVTYLLTLK